MRREELYLADIVEAADAIEHFIEGIRREDFAGDELRRSAVLQKLIVIGEAAARLPVDFKQHHSEVEWPDIVGFRNIAVHEYFAVDWSIVWVTATQDVPGVRKGVARILAEEYPGK
jgi:uncharacterized protein with HEPN domain